MGNTGSTRKFKYGPHGHAVNLASRVQDATKKLGLPLLITASTRERLPATLLTRRIGRVVLPGVREPVVAYELFGEPASPEWLRPSRHLRNGPLAVRRGAMVAGLPGPDAAAGRGGPGDRV